MSARVKLEIEQAEQRIDALKNKLINHSEYEKLALEQQAEVEQPFTNLREKVKTQNTIAVIRDSLRSFKEIEYNSLLKQIDKWVDPIQEVEYVSIQNILKDLDETFLSELAEVEQYLDSLGEALKQEIQNGKRISI